LYGIHEILFISSITLDAGNTNFHRVTMSFVDKEQIFLEGRGGVSNRGIKTPPDCSVGERGDTEHCN
jgi:hypothetical protein